MIRPVWLLPLALAANLTARELPAELSAYVLVPAPETRQPLLKKGDRLAICGDSITWGGQTRTYTARELESGVNLAKDFDNNPLVPAFKKIWDAVSKKQEYETRQIKTLVHGPEGAVDPEATFALTEKARAPLADAILAAKQPVEHVITVAAVE